ncbi:hypothetical protein PB2503_07389 [Parvularcula bermudensis HTCC2503]|uniref:Cytochrome c domain-containing protein n=1 Tax=Parvularcula bermudensis (strain ATCC BAA-594 / HTCC2503 / KCTC 12087) TaxID=314260 RepID=E0TFD4_PARBH|nr:c-type cytochrome [Parvularcula bermudensis]ADM09535.1 hypothetical protein PB2503_07389 [Parvularcula bermudensis HTCC2503]
MNRTLIIAAAILAAVSAFFVLQGTLVRRPDASSTVTPGATLSPAPIAVGDPEIGRRLFVARSCVSCHQVHGIGGRAGPSLDAELWEDRASPEAFFAGMWRGAPLMVELQKLEIGYQIELDGEDLLHLAAFASDKEAQEAFSLDDVPPQMQALFLDKQYGFDETMQDFYDRYRGEEWGPFSRDPVGE